MGSWVVHQGKIILFTWSGEEDRISNCLSNSICGIEGTGLHPQGTGKEPCGHEEGCIKGWQCSFTSGVTAEACVLGLEDCILSCNHGFCSYVAVDSL